jgi:hypothetical protein
MIDKFRLMPSPSLQLRCEETPRGISVPENQKSGGRSADEDEQDVSLPFGPLGNAYKLSKAAHKAVRFIGVVTLGICITLVFAAKTGKLSLGYLTLGLVATGASAFLIQYAYFRLKGEVVVPQRFGERMRSHLEAIPKELRFILPITTGVCLVGIVIYMLVAQDFDRALLMLLPVLAVVLIVSLALWIAIERLFLRK